jgi:translocation and assembly module TamB
VKRSSVVLAATAALLLGAYGGLLWLTGADGTRFLLDRATAWTPGLTLVYDTGSLRKGLVVKRVAWQQEGLSVTASDVRLKPSITTLPFALHLDNVGMALLEITVSGESDGTPVTLPALLNPVAVHFKRLGIDRLSIVDGDTRVDIDHIKVSGKWRGYSIALDQLEAVVYDIALATRGRIALRNNYPLQVDGSFHHAPLQASGRVSVSGDLARLSARIATQKPYSLEVQGWLAPLADDLPFALDASLMQAIDWELGDTALSLAHGDLSLAGQLGAGRGALDLAVDDPLSGTTTLTGTVRWDNDTLRLSEVLVENKHAHLDASCELRMTGNAAGCTAQIARLDLGFLSPQLHSDLSASLHARWTRPEQLQISLTSLSGSFREQPVNGHAELTSEDFAQWTVDALRLDVAGQTLTAAGPIGKDSALNAALHTPDIGQLYAPARGRLAVSAVIDGHIGNPALAVRIEGGGLQLDGWPGGGLGLDGHLTLSKSGRIDAKLAVDNLAWATLRDDVLITVSGTRENATLRVDASGDMPVTARCSVSTERSPAMALVCSTLRGEISLADQQLAWRIEDHLQLHFAADGSQTTLAPLCLRADSAAICLTQPAVFEGTDLQQTVIAVDGMPLAWAQAYWPPELQLRNQPLLSGRATLTSDTLSAELALQRSDWLITRDDLSQRYTLDSAALQLTLDKSRAAVAVQAIANDSQLNADLALLDPRGAQRLQGKVVIRHFDLSSMSWATLDIDRLEGRLDGDFSIAGDRQAPELTGSVAVHDGTLLLHGLPVTLTNIQARAGLAGSHGDFSASFAVDEGSGRLNGEFSLPTPQQPWSLDATLAVDALTLKPLADSALTGNAQLKFSASPEGGRLSGEALVTRARIHLRELPESVYSVSPDAEIVGAEDQSSWPFTADLQVDLGDDFHFEGFGANVDLAGRLRYYTSPQRSHYGYGEVRISKGRYRAYGQRLVVTRGSFLFDGPISDPDVVIEAIRERLPPDIVAGLRISGSLQNPRAELFSEPTMPETEIAHYVLTGKPPSRSIGGEFNPGSTLLSLGLAGSNKPAAALAERFGIRDLELSADTTDQGVEAELSAYLTPKLQVRYGYAMGDSSNTITLQYRLAKNLVVEAISGAAQALDFLYTFEINRRKPDDAAVQKSDEPGSPPGQPDRAEQKNASD